MTSTGDRLAVLPEEYFRVLVEEAADGIFISTDEGRYVEVNASGHRLLGYGPRELVGKAIADILPPREQARLDGELARVAAGAVRTLEWTFTKKDGTPFGAEVTAQRLSRGLIMAIVRDVGTRKTIESRLRDSEERLRSILETAPDIVMTVDRGGMILFINRTLAPLTPEMVIGTCCLDYVVPESRGRVEAALERVFTKREMDEYEVLGPPGSTGQREWSSVRVGPLTEGGRVVAATLCATNVTQRKESEALEARLEAQLRQAQKLESIGRLAGGVAHDFNNLLTSILGYAELARASLPGSSPAVELLEGAVTSAKRGAALTQQLLAFARKKIVRPEVVALGAVLEGMVPMVRRLVGENLEVRLEVASDLGAVKVDVGGLEQVVMNLVVNAKDAIGGAGRITLDAANVRLDEAYCRDHTETSPGDYVRLGVSDTGSGMPPEIAARVFEPFFTTKPVGEGTGLGLAMCEGIVRQAGGHLTVESAAGKGTTFHVFLPRAKESPAASAAPPPAQAPTGGSETLLLVEDDSLILRIATRILASLGYQVLTAEDGVQALAVAQGHAGTISLLITDVVMPNMGGRELATHLRASRPGLRVLFSSGYTADAIAEGGVLDEGIEFLEKPYMPATLAARVRAVLDREVERSGGR